MKTLEQVFGKVKDEAILHSHPTRVMQVKSKQGNFELIWKLKYGNWFLITGSKGWHTEFAIRNNEVQTESAFRRWCRHAKATFHCKPDKLPHFKLLSRSKEPPPCRPEVTAGVH